MVEKEFRINNYIVLKLENNKTNIYIKDKLFRQCRFLLLNIPIEEPESFSSIEAIDEAADKLGWTFNGQKAENEPIKSKVLPEIEFWAHCSNLQAWYENEYNTKIIHRNLAFPLLKKLCEVGDPIANIKFVEEIGKRLESGYPAVIRYLNNEGYLNYLPKEFVLEKLDDPEFLKNLINRKDKTIPILDKFLDFYLNGDYSLRNFLDELDFTEIFSLIDLLYETYDDEFKFPEFFLEKLLWEKFLKNEINLSSLKPNNIEDLFSFFDNFDDERLSYIQLTQFFKFFVVPVIVHCLEGNIKFQKRFLDEFNRRLQSDNAQAPEITMMQYFLIYCERNTLHLLIKNPEIPLSTLLLEILKKLSSIYRTREGGDLIKLDYDIGFWCDDFPQILGETWSSFLKSELVKLIKNGKAEDIYFIFESYLLDLMTNTDRIDIVRNSELGLIEKLLFFLKNEKDFYLKSYIRERALQYENLINSEYEILKKI